MAITMPEINITFNKLATTASARTAVGTVILLMRDATAESTGVTVYNNAASAVSAAASYTEANAQYITDAFDAGAAKVAVVRIGDDIADALATLAASSTTGWVTVCDGETADFTALIEWIAAQETAKRCRYYGIVYNADSPNSQHIVNFCTTSVTFTDSRGLASGAAYLPTLAGILAGCGVETSCTYYVCDTLTAVTEMTSPDAALAAGKLFLVSDGGDIRIARGINSLTDSSVDEDFKFIDVVVVLDMIREDIISTWKDTYAGKKRNTLDNQMLLVAAINTYLESLATEGVLDPDADNTASIDTEAQREAWVSGGTADAETWTDDEVQVKTYRRNVYLTASVRVCGTMDNLEFPITLAS